MIRKYRPAAFFRIFIILPGILLFISSCSNEPVPAHSTGHFKVMDDTLLGFNKGMVKAEDREIGDFISRYQWNMVTTQTGLRYRIYKRGTGRKAENGKTAVIAYSVKLLNGNLCYSSVTDGPRSFTIGHSDVERGLDEGILLLNVGDRAKFILPSHLAFGVLGDQNKIPQNATLVYDVELLEVK